MGGWTRRAEVDKLPEERKEEGMTDKEIKNMKLNRRDRKRRRRRGNRGGDGNV